MRQLLAIGFAAALLAGCVRKGPAAPAEAPLEKVADDSAERSSLLELAHGATVTARTGEVMLELSPLRAIDGEPESFWMNPPHDLPQSTTIALAARSRIEQIGIRTPARGVWTANHVTFESSLDGRTFTPVTTIKGADTNNPQWFAVKPFETSAIRVTIDDPLLPEHDVRLNSVLARGDELEPPRSGDIGGCWVINGQPARFARIRSHVTGILESGKEPLRFDGGFDGRIYRLNWIRGNDYGMTLLTVSPDGQHLSAMNWHEEAIPMFFDMGWYGEKRTCTASIAESDAALELLRRTGRFSLYDDSELPHLLQNLPNAQLVGHEFRYPTAEQNRAASERQLALLRTKFHLPPDIKLVAMGSDAPRQNPVTDVMRALYSTVDLEIRR